ncbi:MAG TPA: murein L,D-transpeptidase catalytic domain family protein [Flavobacterium sp.]|nr:murein L,D-transpeptidase catalytic domain family protein [Flavobacterium sp.]
MIYKFLPILLLLLFPAEKSVVNTNPKKTENYLASVISFETKTENIYKLLDANNFVVPTLEVFSKGLEGFYKLKETGRIQKNILTLIDFSLSANSKRMWIIDMENYTVLYHTWVSHGRNSGEEYASKFSNKSESYQSSLGFYATGETYKGKHGLSLRLDGLEKGINDNARSRAIVIHGADYVSESFIRNNKRLGRSQGCPALPLELTEEIIKLIKEKSCLFIYHPSNLYTENSKLIS